MQHVINIREIELVTSLDAIKLYGSDVLPRLEDQRVRRVNLDKVATLSKGTGRKANIVLSTPAGYKRIQTIVLGVDANSVWIDGGYILPIAAIYAVDMA